MQRSTIREMLAEFLGTLILVTFGCASVAQVLLSGHDNGEYLSINIGWAIGVTLGVYVAGGVSGAHLNPAVTLALAVRRRFPWDKLFPYCLAQLTGAFVASAIVYVTYYDALQAFDGGMRQVVWRARHGRHLGDVSAAVPDARHRRVGRPDRRHRSAALVHLCAERFAEPRTGAMRDTDPCGCDRAGDRNCVWVQRRIRHQPRARFGPTIVHVRGGLGRRSIPRRSLLVVDTHCGPAGRWCPGRLDLRSADHALASARGMSG